MAIRRLEIGPEMITYKPFGKPIRYDEIDRFGVGGKNGFLHSQRDEVFRKILFLTQHIVLIAKDGRKIVIRTFNLNNGEKIARFLVILAR